MESIISAGQKGTKQITSPGRDSNLKKKVKTPIFLSNPLDIRVQPATVLALVTVTGSCNQYVTESSFRTAHQIGKMFYKTLRGRGVSSWLDSVISHLSPLFTRVKKVAERRVQLMQWGESTLTICRPICNDTMPTFKNQIGLSGLARGSVVRWMAVKNKPGTTWGKNLWPYKAPSPSRSWQHIEDNGLS